MDRSTDCRTRWRTRRPQTAPGSFNAAANACNTSAHDDDDDDDDDDARRAHKTALMPATLERSYPLSVAGPHRLQRRQPSDTAKEDSAREVGHLGTARAGCVQPAHWAQAVLETCGALLGAALP